MALADWAPLPLPVLGLVIATALALLFLWLMGGFAAHAFANQSNYLSNVGTGLFFACVNAYAIVAGTFVVRRATTILQELEPELTCDQQELAAAHGWITGGPAYYMIPQAIVAIVLGLGHSVILADIDSGLVVGLIGDPLTAAQTFGTLMSWFVITHLISQFVIIAQTFARLGSRYTEVDLLNPEHLAPYSRIALQPALGLVGLQMMYPLLSLGGTFNAAAVIPGFLMGLGALIYLLVAPNIGLRRKVIVAKRAAIEDINQQIHTWQNQHERADPEALAALQPLLSHRTYLQHVPEWPMGIASLLRWGLYVVIPPMTWAAAALMEIAIDQFIS